MNTKIMALLMLVMLFASPVLAAITITWVTPSSGQTFNNLPANAAFVDLNFTVVDNNADVLDNNVTIIVYSGDPYAVFRTLVTDFNVRDATDNPTATTSCDATVDKGLGTYSCAYHWDMPLNADMPDGPYYIDANVKDVFSGADGVAPSEHDNFDANTSVGINVSTSLANAASIRALLLVISLVAVAGVLIIGVVSIYMFNTNPTTTALATVSAMIVIGIVAMVLGTIVAMI